MTARFAIAFCSSLVALKSERNVLPVAGHRKISVAKLAPNNTDYWEAKLRQAGNYSRKNDDYYDVGWIAEGSAPEAAFLRRSVSECPLLGAKQTCLLALRMSACDPKADIGRSGPLSGSQGFA